MSQLTISDVARQVGLQSSAIRYYERIGLLPSPPRKSGQRRYDSTALYRLAIIQSARELGFTLEEIRQLFFGFRDVTRASERWQELSKRKLSELDDLMDGIREVRALLRKLMSRCRCATLDQCGKGIFESMKKDGAAKPCLPVVGFETPRPGNPRMCSRERARILGFRSEICVEVWITRNPEGIANLGRLAKRSRPGKLSRISPP